ncbi:MAG: hypothetical protein ICV69_05375 [Thermoleophilaceae bacterium]|nr:hypothetical protein [Thermoleophilaceae bacterium]
MELGLAEFHSGEVVAAIDELSAAMAATDNPQARVDVASRLIAPFAFAGRPEETVAALTEMIAGLPEDAVELGLQLQASRFGVAHSSLRA